jgi:hypothetical protein
MSAIDEELRVALDRLYPAGDPSGVSIDVWERVAAGETGTPAGPGDVPGGGGGLLSWLPWLGGALVVGLLGLGIGASGLIGRPTNDISTAPTAGVVRAVDALDCPGGAPVLALAAGSRVIALQTTADGGWVSVRDPLNVSRAGWLPAGALTPDTGSFADLPVGSCAVVEIAAPAPTATPTPDATQTPGATPEPSTPTGPAPDTTAPVLGSPSVVYSPAVGYTCSEQPGSIATVTVTATDAVGVTAVGAVLSGADSGSRTLSPAGGSSWSIAYHPSGLSVTGAVTFTITAQDASGNTSAPIQVVVQRDQCPG